MKKAIIFLLSLVALLCSLSGAAFADSKVSGPPTGITVSPAYLNVNILEGESQVPVNFTLTNNEPSPQTITLKTADFNALNYTGGLLFVGSKASSFTTSHGLSKWLSLPETSVTLSPKQSEPITVNINNDSDLPPGGHYGGLLLSVGGIAGANNKNKVDVQPVASALMFVTKLTGATYKLGLSRVTTNASFFSLPSQVTLLFYNNGNTQVTPRGYITLSSPNGKLVKKGIINTNSGLILPGNSRYFVTPLMHLASSNAIGHYTLSVNFTFDGLSAYRQYQSKIFLGAPILLIIFLVVVILVGLLIYFMHKKGKLDMLYNLIDIILSQLKKLKSHYLPKSKASRYQDSRAKFARRIPIKIRKIDYQLPIKVKTTPKNGVKKSIKKATTKKSRKIRIKGD